MIGNDLVFFDGASVNLTLNMNWFIKSNGTVINGTAAAFTILKTFPYLYSMNIK